MDTVIEATPVPPKPPSLKEQPKQRPAKQKQPAQKPSVPQPAAPKPPEHTPLIQLRSEPMMVSTDEFKKIFGLDENWRPLKYMKHDYVDQGDVVLDRATGLMWQKSGSKKWLTYPDAEKYIKDVNRQKFAGYADWRLPTIPELMSLLEPEKQFNELYINPIFDSRQGLCWSVDRMQIKGERSSGWAWDAYFDDGSVYWRYLFSLSYVRAVRP
jgi:eukaryotic-like serine/threonine-protein kinase